MGLPRTSVTINSTGERFILFYGANNPNGVCSNFYPSAFEIDGKTFKFVEQYMMYEKAVMFGDFKTAKMILLSVKPSACKSLGRQVKNYNDVVWSACREKVVERAVRAKFTQNLELKKWMQGLDRIDYFVECSPTDRIWGIGLGVDSGDTTDITRWDGMNLLGKILKRVYDDIRKAG